ncbi:gluconate 2-dehydrogenase subunit 3 family protein [Bryobacter aggregatus]|uniref:gluconate 2-dehydrogenase subunit 3 family protein n=1 Tax=Bryobacter aggregatus TaxID=360054 RepID=UPI0004E14D9C|nr:gluconate 2-dehydrogenase subunit 3 family protein [Bryobacter aggregatus]
MKRRKFFAQAAAIPAAGSLLAQQGAPTPPGAPNRAAMELPKLDVGISDDVATMAPKFFNAAQFAALKRLSEILVPTPEGGVGAKEANAAEFLDFLIGQSPADRQHVYTAGLNVLVAAGFSKMNDAQAAAALAPLRKPWTFEPSSDPLTRFLQTAKADVRNATQNSKEFSVANASASRRFGGVGLYWYPLD